MSTCLERYEKLRLRDSLYRAYDYPLACKELTFILRVGYAKVSKNLQFVIFQDTLSAFRLLPQVHTQSGMSAANLLLQAAEAALPKQKKVLAVTEFKHAVVAHKRRCKTQQDGEGSVQLCQDVLVHIFSFLDMRSLVAAGFVCWSWSIASNSNQLWQSQCDNFFGSSGWSGSIEKIDKTSEGVNSTLYKNEEGMDPTTVIDWKESFKRAYIGKFRRGFRTNMGYCGHCKSVVWLSNIKCSNLHHCAKFKNPQITPMSSQQVVDYLLDDSDTDSSLLSTSSSDSDSDSDVGSVSKLWAYPRNIVDRRKKSFI